MKEIKSMSFRDRLLALDAALIMVEDLPVKQHPDSEICIPESLSEAINKLQEELDTFMVGRGMHYQAEHFKKYLKEQQNAVKLLSESPVLFEGY